MVESFHDCKIAELRIDNGCEYNPEELKSYCIEKGIQLNYSVAYNPEMNSISERVNRTLMDEARTMLNASGLDKICQSLV